MLISSTVFKRDQTHNTKILKQIMESLNLNIGRFITRPVATLRSKMMMARKEHRS